MAFVQYHPDPTLSPDVRADIVERVDIIAVHGLEPDSFSSAVEPLNNGKLWIRDFLPKYIRHSRILVYNYDSISAFSHETTNDTLQYFGREFLTATYNHRVTDPRRPIIIIAYSLGGLVVKAALAQASIDRKYAAIVKSTYSILLFGTPLQRLPSDTSLRSVISEISQKLLLPLPRTRSPFRSLSLGSSDLTNASLHYGDTYKAWVFERSARVTEPVSCSHILVVLFYEGIGCHDMRGLEIYKSSFKHVSSVMLSKDHRSLCRFPSEADLDFQIVIDKIHSLSDEAINYVPYRKEIDSFDIQLLRKLYTPKNELRKDRTAYRYPGTCEWILSHPSYLQWLQSGPSKVLWITGLAGAGKTTLASFLYDTFAETSYGAASSTLVGDSTNFQVHPFHGRTISVAYFCDYNLPTSAAEILRSLIHQLLNNEPSLMRYINPNEKLQCNSLAAVPSLLGGLLSRFSDLIKVSVIIDAVDELDKSTLDNLFTALDIQCAHSKGLASSPPDHDLLFCSALQCQSSMKFMITSRSEKSFWSRAAPPSNFPVSHIDMSLSSAATSISSDLGSLVDDYLDQLPLKKYQSQEKKESLKDLLVQRPHGSFLWSTAVLRQLAKNSDHFSISRLPTDLNLIYTQILESISSDMEKEAAILLQWVTFAKRPLTVSELREVIHIDEGIGHLSSLELDRTQQYRPHIPKSVQHLNGLLIEVHDSKVHFIHQSVRDFLLSREFYTYSEANLHLAATCMDFLILSDLRLDGSDRILKGDILKQPAILGSQFLHYAALYWLDHFASIADGMDKLNFQLNILENPKSVSFQLWFRYFWIFNTELWERKIFPKYPTKLIVLAFIGDIQTLGHQLEHGNVSVDECTPAGEDWTPLIAAAWIGNLDVVDLLCQHHAGVSAGTKRNSLALYYAIERGHIDIAHKLIQHFLNMYPYDAGHHLLDSPGPSGLTPLAISILDGQEKISRLLLSSGANPNQPLGIVAKLDSLSDVRAAFSTPLTLAIFRRYEPEFVEFLIGAGGQIRSSSLLCTAARWGTPSVSKLLLAAGASLEDSSEHWKTAILQAAVLSRDQTTSELFIRLWKSLYLNDLSIEAPLIVSSTSGKTSILKGLLDKYPRNCVPISQALPYSVKFGHYPITKLLLERQKATKSEINAAYQALSSDGPLVPFCGMIPYLTEDTKMKSLEVLLDHRLDVNLRDHNGNTPLHIFTSQRYVAAVRLLVKYACEINAQNLAGQTAMNIAANHGDAYLIQLLFDHGAEIDQPTLDNVLNSGCQEAVLTINSLLQHRAVSSLLRPLRLSDSSFGARFSYFYMAPNNKFARAAVYLKSLQIVNLQDMLVSADNNFSYSNGFKSYLEDFTGMEWDWWPMLPRLHPLKHGQVWFKWRCYGGCIHMRRISSSLAAEIKELQKYELFLIDLGILSPHDPTPSDPLIKFVRGFCGILHWLLENLQNQLQLLAYSQEIQEMVVFGPHPLTPQRLPSTPVPMTTTHFSQATTRRLISFLLMGFLRGFSNIVYWLLGNLQCQIRRQEMATVQPQLFTPRRLLSILLIWLLRSFCNIVHWLLENMQFQIQRQEMATVRPQLFTPQRLLSVPSIGFLRCFCDILYLLLENLQLQLQRLVHKQEMAGLRSQPFTPQRLSSTPVLMTATQFPQTTTQPNLPSIPNQAVTRSVRCQSPLPPQRQRLRKYPSQNLAFVGVKNQKYQYLVIKACGVYDNIRIDECNSDMEFFRILKHHYTKVKGPLRRWFSIYDIDHCNFDRYIKMRQNLIISDSKGTDSSDDHYLPKPPDDLDYVCELVQDNPPISAKVFRCNLRACPEQCFWPKFLHCCDAANDREYSAYHTASYQSWPVNGYLKRVPKRKEPWDIHGGGPGRAYGLTCFERLSFFKLLVWFFVTEIGPVIFWVLWLLLWDHSGDLQNASLPFMVVLGLWTIYVASFGLNGPEHR